MPHISKIKIDKKIKDDLEEQLLILIQDSGAKARLKILQELLTRIETVMLAKRLGVIMLIERKISTHDISRLLGLSPSTVARFESKTEQGKYRHTAEWVRKNKRIPQLEKLLEGFVTLLLSGRKRSLQKIVDAM